MCRKLCGVERYGSSVLVKARHFDIVFDQLLTAEMTGERYSEVTQAIVAEDKDAFHLPLEPLLDIPNAMFMCFHPASFEEGSLCAATVGRGNRCVHIVIVCGRSKHFPEFLRHEEILSLCSGRKNSPLF